MIAAAFFSGKQFVKKNVQVRLAQGNPRCMRACFTDGAVVGRRSIVPAGPEEGWE